MGGAGGARTGAASRDVGVAQCAFFGAGVRAVDAHDAANAGVALRGLFIIGPDGRLRQKTVNDLPVGRSGGWGPLEATGLLRVSNCLCDAAVGGAS